MKLVTSALMQQIDRETIDNVGIPGPTLMENAGRGIAEGILEDILAPIAEPRVTVVCGKGNNGGDGFVVARYLHEAGVVVDVFFQGPVDKLSLDARLNYDRLQPLGVTMTEITSPDVLPDTLDSDFIIDAVFGTGFSGAPRGITAEMIEYMNVQPQPTIAVDMPSGLNADNGRHDGVVVEADYTYTLALPKYGLFISPGRELSGNVTVIPIGIPESVVEQRATGATLVTPELVLDLLPLRVPEGHKGTFGKVLLVAGSTGMTGAAALAAHSVLRSGSGLAKIACPRSILGTIAALGPEPTLHPLPDVAKKGAIALRALGEVRQLAAEHDAVVIGPGLGRHHETAELVRRFVARLERPSLIDADGLNAFEGTLDSLRESPATPVITPHPGEFKRLSGVSVPADIHEKIEIASSFARDHKVVLVLKGSPTLIASPQGDVYLNPIGNDGMATGGSGDVLSGVIGSLLGQGMTPIDAAVCGVYVHSLAGDMASEVMGARSVIAGDIAGFLPDAFRELDEA